MTMPIMSAYIAAVAAASIRAVIANSPSKNGVTFSGGIESKDLIVFSDLT